MVNLVEFEQVVAILDSIASPAIVDKEMYLRGYRYLYRISED